MSVKARGSSMSGPIRTKNPKSASVTVTALAAGSEETYVITDSDARVGDVIVVSPRSAEAGWGVIRAWVSAAGQISVAASNFGAGALTGGSLTVDYRIL